MEATDSGVLPRGSTADDDSSAVLGRLARQLADLVEPFGGTVYSHAPADRPFQIAALARPDDGRDRWGTSGTRTIFLATDQAITLAEYARHREPGAPADERRIMCMGLPAVTVVDVRRRAVAEMVGGPADPRGLVDRQVARQIAATVRRTGVCQGLLVPSVAYLDRPERFNVVLFEEHLGRDLGDLIRDVREVGRVRLDGD